MTLYTDFSTKLPIDSAIYLDYAMMNRSILFLPQHHQGDDNDGRYDNPSNHKPNNGTFVRSHILSKKDLPLKMGNHL